MVATTDLKCYKTTNGLGGAITATKISHATPNNLFSNVPNNERVIGEDYFQCCYFKNEHAVDSMDNFKLWLTYKSLAHDVLQNIPVVSFDGVDDYIDCTNDATLWSQSLTKFSFSFWIYPTKDGVGGSNLNIVQHAGTSAQGFRSHLPNAANTINFMIRNSVNTAFDAQSTALVINQWNFVTCVYDNSLVSANVKIYVNGVLGSVTANLTEAINLSTTLRLADSSNDFQGYMKDFKWWTTTALTQQNIDDMMNGWDILVPTPNYWLPMTEGISNPVDKISGTKVGTLNGAIWQYIENKIITPDTVIKWAFDPLNPSVKFDGINDYINCTNDATLWSRSLTKFSFSFWVYPTAGWDAVTRFVVRHGSGAQRFSCYIDSAVSGRIIFQMVNSLGVGTLANNDTLQLNKWNFVTCVYDNSLVSDNMKIYVNAVVGTNQNFTEAVNNSAILSLGGSDYGSDCSKGNMKAFKWWTTTALSQTDVNNLLIGEDDLVPRPDYNLPLNEGTGNPVDLISRSKVGTFSGAIWNTDAITIPNKYTAPGGVTWRELGSEPVTPDIIKLAAGRSFPIWVWYHVNANAESRLDDSELFAFALDIPSGGTGSGGTGGSETGYHYGPYGTFNGTSDFVSQADSPELNLSNFSMAAWFRTSKDYTIAGIDGTIISKGGVGFDPPNQNYGIRVFKDTNMIRAGFETSGGIDHEPSSDPIVVNDGLWHYVVCTNDGIVVRLYLDGVQVKQHTYGPGDVPENNANPLVIGRNSNDSSRFFQGDIDEVRVWNSVLTATEVLNSFNDGIVPQESNIVYENIFGGSDSGTGGGGGTGGNPPPAVSNYKIAFASDWGCESETDDVIDLINDNGYDIIVSAGDNAYASASCFTNRFQALEAAGKVYGFAYGNHEYSESGGIAPYISFFGHPRTYFTFKFQNFFFLVIDSNINMDPGSAQHNFILSELKRVQTDNTIVWKAALFHHPMYGSDSDHSYNDGESVEAFHSLFEQYGVTFALCAHNHNMQRSHQVVRNNSDPENPTVVDSTPPFVKNNTVIEVISGAGGHDNPDSLYSLGSKPSFMAYQSNDYNGVWEMIASNNGKTLTCSFVDTSGDKYDTFVITAP